MRFAIVPLLLALALPALAQEKKFDPNMLTAGVDMQKVEAAIEKGVKFLRTAPSPKHDLAGPNSDELIAYTLVTAGLPETDPTVAELLKKILEAPIERTYKTAIQAMLLEEIHRVRYQSRIQQCGQFLVDNQCANGQWSYGQPTEAAKGTPSVATGGSTPSGGGVKTYDLPPPSGKDKPKIEKKLGVRKTRDGPPTGDNSNSQYAALGLRACYDAGIMIPKDTIGLALNWWRVSQYSPTAAGKNDKPAVASGAPSVGDPRGWCYDGKDSHQAYGSMSVGAVGALVIYAYMLDHEWQKDAFVKHGMGWIASNYSITENPGQIGVQHNGAANSLFHYYYLYGLERVGMLYGTDNMGGHFWYAEGAKLLIEKQKPDGKWDGEGWAANPTWDTCFAILFLKRATRPLVATEAGGSKPAKGNK
jgi:hypothetical protein